MSHLARKASAIAPSFSARFNPFDGSGVYFICCIRFAFIDPMNVSLSSDAAPDDNWRIRLFCWFLFNCFVSTRRVSLFYPEKIPSSWLLNLSECQDFLHYTF